MNRLERIIKPNVLNLEPYTSARDENQSSEGVFLDANENPYPFAYRRYPDPYQRELKNKISKWRGVDVENIFLGNGSDEVIDLLIRCTCISGKDRILSLDPSYGMYKVSAAVNEVAIDLTALHKDLSIDRESLFSTLDDHHKLIFINSPNNPNGGTIPTDIIEEVLNTTRNLVIIDEAYIDFADGASWCKRLKDYDNLIVLQTFSKSFGAAGVRVGMGFMNQYLVDILNKIKPPYNISIPNQVAAIDRLDAIGLVNESIQKIKETRDTFASDLNALKIVEYVFPSQANFLLVRFIDHKKVFEVLNNHRIIVRDRSSNTNCERCLRISIGSDVEMNNLMEVLKTIE